MIPYFAFTIILVWLLYLATLLFFKPKDPNGRPENYPLVSILISLRNEASNVESLCESLNALLYPKSRFEILFGDDGSEDNTLELLKKHKPENAAVYSLGNEQTGDFGKQKVLNVLSKEANGEYFLFTDADMIFQSEWIQGMLSQATESNVLVVGMTKVEGKGFMASLQNMDWLFNEWLIGWFSKLGISLTAWGNNMLISKSAYNDIGGHDQLADTIVEDVRLLRALVTNGGNLKVNFNPNAVAITQPTSTFLELLYQRKRWIKGVNGFNPIIWAGGLIKGLFWPSVIFVSFGNPFGLLLAFLAILFRFLILKRIETLTKSQFSILHYLIFEVYDFAFYLITFAFYILPIRVDWKGRKY